VESLFRDILSGKYWQHVSTMVDTAGEKKYERLGYIAKAALTISWQRSS